MREMAAIEALKSEKADKEVRALGVSQPHYIGLTSLLSVSYSN